MIGEMSARGAENLLEFAVFLGILGALGLVCVRALLSSPMEMTSTSATCGHYELTSMLLGIWPCFTPMDKASTFPYSELGSVNDGITYSTPHRNLMSGSGPHRWELPGNYRDFIVVMVFYLFCWRTKRIIVTPITYFKIYILIQSLMLFI